MKRRPLLLSLLTAASGCASPSAPIGRIGIDPFAGATGTPPPSTACSLTRRGAVPLTIDRLIHVEARINGGRATLVLDTGAERSIISPEVAKRLAVTQRYDFDRSVAGIGASVRTGDARLQSFTLGEVALSDPRILVGPIGPLGADGLLGADLLAEFDLDLDVPRRQLTLYDRVQCETLRPPWPGRFVTLETTRSLDAHPFFPVKVNGQELSATIDTGAQRTTMTAAAAARVGVTGAALASDPVALARGVGGETLRTAIHQFQSFTVGGDAFRGPVLVAPGIALPRDSAVVIGLDFLLTRRMWLSYGSRRIFLAPG